MQRRRRLDALARPSPSRSLLRAEPSGDLDLAAIETDGGEEIVHGQDSETDHHLSVARKHDAVGPTPVPVHSRSNHQAQEPRRRTEKDVRNAVSEVELASCGFESDMLTVTQTTAPEDGSDQPVASSASDASSSSPIGTAAFVASNRSATSLSASSPSARRTITRDPSEC